MLSHLAAKVGRRLARLLNRPLKQYELRAELDEEFYRAILRPGDVILVEGNSRLSAAIKYLTQSTWSHACIYVGDSLGCNEDGEQLDLVEADIEQGVIAVSLGKSVIGG